MSLDKGANKNVIKPVNKEQTQTDNRKRKLLICPIQTKVIKPHVSKYLVYLVEDKNT